MASFAIDKSSNGKFKYSTNALIKETTIVEEDPKPEPGGIEQYVEISMGNNLLSL